MGGHGGREALARVRRVVVKVGTAVVTRPDGHLALGRLASLVEQLHALRVGGRQVILVTSGAVGVGAERLGFDKAPRSVVDRQACAAAGQSSLMAFYDGLFGRLGSRVAQVLLTEDDFKHRHRHVHLAATLERLLELGVVPIVNENDTVSTAEIALVGPKVFGDNDRLAALVASGLDAQLLVLLTDVDGVYDRPPEEPGARRLSEIAGESVVVGAASPQGRGGMGSKLASARLAAEAGVHVVVAAGRERDVLPRLVAGEDVGTWFPAAHKGLSGKQRWLAHATAPVGRLVVNAGARASLVERKASLLLPGVLSVEGSFPSGSVVSLVDEAGREFARGRADRSADEIKAALVSPPARGKALVHRDHVVILEEAP